MFVVSRKTQNLSHSEMFADLLAGLSAGPKYYISLTLLKFLLCIFYSVYN